MDILVWDLEMEKVPVAFGIFKLIIAYVVEAEKVSVDDVQEKIEPFEDMVQSVEADASLITFLGYGDRIRHRVWSRIRDSQ
jgi:translation elongation factor EF-1beta